MEQTQRQITNLKTLQESYALLADAIGFLATATAPVHNLAVELETGKEGIVNALRYMNVDANTSETLNLLAEKITLIQGYEVITTPVNTANETANLLFRTMFAELRYDQRYEEVKANYCGEGNPYAGLLMTVLYKNTTAAMNLTGADAYYILEEDIFYTTDESGNLVLFTNGLNAPLNTVSHGFNTNITTPIRTVFYLYTENSTASGDRENTIGSMLDYCYNTKIPNIKYKSNSGTFKYYHVSNPDTCNLLWDGGTTGDGRSRFFYTNVEVMDGLWMMHNIGANIIFYSVPNLKTVRQGRILGGAPWQQVLTFNSLETAASNTSLNVYFLDDIRMMELNFPSLKSLNQSQFLNNDPCLEILTMPELETAELSFADRRSINNVALVKELRCPKLSRMFGYRSASCLFYMAGLEELELADTVTVQSAINSNSENGLHIKTKTIISENPQATNINTNGPGDWYGKKLYFDTLERGVISLGGTGSYSNKCTDLYLGCYGEPTDEIKVIVINNTGAVSPGTVEIREGARQAISLYGFRNLTADGIVSGIFEKLADNSFLADGVTPAEPITITLETMNLNKLSDELKIIATSKNYILA